jgi:hypothetical protein
MKLTEVQQPSDQKLFEEIDPQNDTGFLTEDLVKITRAKDGAWSAPMTSEQLTEKIRRLCGGQA